MSDHEDYHISPKDDGFLRSQALGGIVALIQLCGEDPSAENTFETPNRVLKAMLEMTEGSRFDPRSVLDKSFPLDEADPNGGAVYDELILSRDIPFTSLCIHHMLPFTGVAHVAYIPKLGGRVVGLSKLARLVDGYAKRLQIQERLGMQIADALEERLEPRGTAVILKAQHSCQCLRGVKKDGWMVTSVMRGYFRDNKDGARAELLDLIRL